MVKMNMSPRLAVMTRRKVLHHTVSEIAWRIIPSERVQAQIKAGVLEKELFRTLVFRVLNSSKRIVAEFSIDIDWEKHRVNAAREGGDVFQIDENQSVAEQVIAIATRLAKLIDDTKQKYPGSTTTCVYTYREEIYADEAKLKAARDFLGFSPSTDDWADKTADWDFVFEHTPEALNEIKFTARHKR